MSENSKPNRPRLRSEFTCLLRAAFIFLIIISSFGAPAFGKPFPSLAIAQDRNSHHQLKEFEQFLEKNPAIEADLKKDPSLVNNKDYLAKHPDLQKFVGTHPGLLQELMAKDESCSIPIPSIFDRVSPAVVYINAMSINPYQSSDRVEHIIGSGFIFDASGLILTNSHVAFARQMLSVTLDDGTTYPAQLVGADPIFDIAVLRIPKPDKVQLQTIPLGDSDHIHVGEDAIAIGNPLGLDQTLTRGIVSAINRIMPGPTFSLQEPLIQVDTPINPGNSGGPLLNRCGEAVGITTAIIPDASNIGFAVPINLVKATLPSLISQGHLVRPWLGFHGQFVDADLQKFLKIPLDVGFLVEVVEPDSPAAMSGMQGGSVELTLASVDMLVGGDIITKMNGTTLSSPEQIISVLDNLKVGASLDMTVFRDGKYLDIDYVLPERPLLPGDIPAHGSTSLVARQPASKRLPTKSVFRF